MQTCQTVEKSAQTHLPRHDVMLCLLSFLMMFSYAVLGSIVHSLFLEVFPSQQLATVWLCVAACSAWSCYYVGKKSQKLAAPRLFYHTMVLCTALFTGMLWLQSWALGLGVFLLYIFKDIYIIVLVEIFWTLINTVFSHAFAQSRYGVYCAAGSIGSLAGNFCLGVMLGLFKTSQCLWLLLLNFIVLTVIAAYCQNFFVQVDPAKLLKTSPKRGGHFLLHSLHVVQKSKYLLYLLGLVATTQITMTVIDYQFSYFLQYTYPALEERTQTINWIGALINGLSLGLQLLMGPILRWLGVQNSLIASPLILIGFLLYGFWGALPQLFGAMKVVSKSLDYSLFRCSKEMVYLPLSYSEKTQGKAVVDVLMYRCAKAAGSLSVLLFPAFLAQPGFGLGFDLILCMVWYGLGKAIAYKYGLVAPGPDHRPVAAAGGAGQTGRIG